MTINAGFLVDTDQVATIWNAVGSDQISSDVITIIARQCSVRIETYCGRKLAATDLVEFYEGTGDPHLVLNNFPVNSIASVYEDQNAAGGQASGAFGSTTLLTQGVDYELMKTGSGGGADSGILRRINGIWQKSFAYVPGQISPASVDPSCTIKVSYNAGLTAIPEDLQQACMILMAAVKRIIGKGDNVTSEGWEDYNYTVSTAAEQAMGGMPPAVLGMLSRRYRTNAVG